MMMAMRKPSRSAVDWLTLGPEPYMATCKRCGARIDKPPLPATMGAVVKYLAYAEEAHRHCKPNVLDKEGAI